MDINSIAHKMYRNLNCLTSFRYYLVIYGIVVSHCVVHHVCWVCMGGLPMSAHCILWCHVLSDLCHGIPRQEHITMHTSLSIITGSGRGCRASQ